MYNLLCVSDLSLMLVLLELEEWEVADHYPQWEETGLSPQEQVGGYYQLRREQENVHVVYM